MLRIVVAAAMLTLLPMSATASPLRLMFMGEDDTLEFVYRQQGCFHRRAFTLTIHGGNRYRASLSGERLPHSIEVDLSVADAVALDDLILHLRALQSPGRCTALLYADLVWTRPGSPEVRESFEDFSCRQPPDSRNTLRALYELLEQHAEPGQSRRLGPAPVPGPDPAQCPEGDNESESGHP
ncbi:MAG TPA: hypothetical protein PKZ76_01235 [Xanthomonadaceae bacterium]|nr:hypothetical protein [Xanthomonadaceae bacterium]